MFWLVEAHTEGQTARSQNILDFSQGFLAQVGRFQQFYFGALNQIADVVNVLCFEAVSRTYSQFQVINRTEEDRIDLIFLLDNNRLTVTFEVDERSQLLLQNGCSAANSLFRVQSTAGLQVNNQLVQVSTLLNTSVFNHVRHTAYRAE